MPRANRLQRSPALGHAQGRPPALPMMGLSLLLSRWPRYKTEGRALTRRRRRREASEARSAQEPGMTTSARSIQPHSLAPAPARRLRPRPAAGHPGRCSLAAAPRGAGSGSPHGSPAPLHPPLLLVPSHSSSSGCQGSHRTKPAVRPRSGPRE